MERTTYIIISLVLASLTFIMGQAYQFKQDEAIVNQALELSVTCDLQTNGYYKQYGDFIEVDCLTPESYKVLNSHFFKQVISDSNLSKLGLIRGKCEALAEDYSLVPCDYWSN